MTRVSKPRVRRRVRRTEVQLVLPPDPCARPTDAERRVRYEEIVHTIRARYAAGALHEEYQQLHGMLLNHGYTEQWRAVEKLVEKAGNEPDLRLGMHKEAHARRNARVLGSLHLTYATDLLRCVVCDQPTLLYLAFHNPPSEGRPTWATSGWTIVPTCHNHVHAGTNRLIRAIAYMPRVWSRGDLRQALFFFSDIPHVLLSRMMPMWAPGALPTQGTTILPVSPPQHRYMVMSPGSAGSNGSNAADLSTLQVRLDAGGSAEEDCYILDLGTTRTL